MRDPNTITDAEWDQARKLFITLVRLTGYVGGLGSAEPTAQWKDRVIKGSPYKTEPKWHPTYAYAIHQLREILGLE